MIRSQARAIIFDVEGGAHLDVNEEVSGCTTRVDGTLLVSFPSG